MDTILLQRLIYTVPLLLATPAILAQTPEDNDDTTIETVEVLGSRQANYTEITAETEKLVSMAGTFGDPIVAITTLPGVIMPVGGNEPAVRGSSPADNRYFIDGIPAGYIFHEFNTSVLDKDTIQNFELYSAGFGAQYAGATGAVFDVRLRDPKQQPITTTVTASMLRAGVLIEGSVTDDSAFYLSARKGLIQFFLPEEDEDEDDDGIRVQSPPEDDDYVLKYQWHVSDNNQLTLNAFGASDYAEAELNDQADMVAANPDFAGDAKIDHRYNSYGATWLHSRDDGKQLKFTAAQWKDKNHWTWGDNYFDKLILKSTFLNAEFKTPLGQSHTITLGVQQDKSDFDYSTRSVWFVCTEFDVDCQDGRREIIEAQIDLSSNEETAYLIDFWQVNRHLSVETGVQYTQEDYLDSHQVNPRIAMTWAFTDKLALTSSAGRYNRFADVGTVLEDYGNPELDPPTSEHYTLGLKGETGNSWTWHLEGYYKTLDNLPLAIGDDEDDAELFYSNDTSGTARGVDLLVNKNLVDRWYGWMSLSYSRSQRTNERTHETQDYRLDTPVVLNLVGNYKFSRTWQAGFRFLAKSGEAKTEIIGIKDNPFFEGQYLADYGEPFAQRLPTYSRLDLRVQKDMTMFGNDALFFVDIINALNRQNITEENLDYEKVNDTGELHIEKETDIGIFPSVGISFTF